MKNVTKRLLAMLLCCLLIVTSVGCGKDNSSNDDVKNGSNGTTETNSKNDDSNVQAQSNLKYEISDKGFKYRTDASGETVYTGYVEITNTGDCDIYMDKCIFDFEDNDGHLLQSDKSIWSFSSVVSPGEKGYFFNYIGAMTFDKGVSLDNGINLVPQITLTKAIDKPASCAVSDVSVRLGDYNEIKVIGRIENTSDKDIENLWINAIFYDAEGKVMALYGSSEKNVRVGMKSSFEFSFWGGDGFFKLEDIASTKVVAEEIYIQSGK